MVAGLARSDLHTSYRAGAGKLRERTLVFGSHVIAVDSIGSATLVERGRSWWLALLGVLIAAGSAYAVNLYGPIAWAGAGFGALAVLVNILLPVERHISIGAADGHITTIHSNNSAFLRRLLDVLTEKINSRNPALLASFDISGGTVHLVAPPPPPAPILMPSPVVAPTPPQEQPALAADVAANDAGNKDTRTAEPSLQSLRSAAEIDETLFANDPDPMLKPRPANDADRELPRAIAPAAHDPLLDGPSVRPTRNEPDWMTHPNAALGRQAHGQSGVGRWLLPALVIVVLAGGAVAAWVVLRQPGGASTISLLAAPPVEEASFETSPITSSPAPAESATTPSAAAPVESEPVARIVPLPATPGFATLAPRILEPAEGVHFSGGPQLVRLTWSTLIEARSHVIEIEAFDATAGTWTDSWGPGRVTVGSDNEVAENIPAVGRWRWRVRGVAAAGEQSKFSAWSEFTVSD